MLKSLRLQFGLAPEHSPLSIPVGSAVIFVGPNNSGKSRLLQELERFLRQEDKETSRFSNLFKKHKREDDNYRILSAVGAKVPGNSTAMKLLAAQVREELPKEIFSQEGSFTDVESSAKILGVSGIATLMDMVKKDKLIISDEHEMLVRLLNTIPSGDLFPLAFIRGFGKKSWIEERDAVERVAIEEALGAGVTLLRDLRDIAQRRNAEDAILSVMNDGRLNVGPYLSLLGPKTVRLDGRQRLAHVKPTGLPSRDSRGDNLFTRFLRNDSARESLRDVVFDAFGQYLSFDVSNFEETILKFSPEPPGDYELMPLKPEAVSYFQRAQEVEDFSDGVKSFIGLLCSVLCDEYLVMLIDEPEAFLHPPLARKLGQRLHELALRRKAHVLAATHSADFLMGCIQAGPDVNIVRLTYRHGNPTARLLPLEDLQQMMHDPLLRSTGMLSALFHDGAIVCEGDSDRAFYQEINERLCGQKKEGVDGCLFINAHSKQAIHRVVGPLRKMGVPAVAIVDLDIVIDDDVLKDLLAAVSADAAMINTLGMAKGQVYQLFIAEAKKESQNEKDIKAGAKALLKSKGLRALTDKQQRTLKALFFDPLAQQGIFVVPVGEVEGWLLHLLPEGAPPRKGNWLNTIFQAIGTNPRLQGYAHAEKGDVWDFMRDITQWINDPNHQGIPSL